jgi:amino-acid N-acetyltransferase
MMTGVRMRQVTATDLPQISRFLEENGLPTIGVEKFFENFLVALDQSGSWVGIAGLEVYGKSGLLRSVAVDKQFRGMGHGRTLVNTVLANARKKGIETVYLLTDDAEDYFKGLGFQVVSRKDIDEAVRASPEFTECRKTAPAMRKFIR